jgi:hypothetical protein
MRGGAFIQPIEIEVYTFVKVTNVINHANFGGCILEVGFCEGPTLGFSHRKMKCPYNSALRYRAGV